MPSAPAQVLPITSLLPAGRALRGADILAFNQALAAIASAGLPLEQGLRLAAADARSSRIKHAIESLAADLESGLSLSAAFDKNRAAFPPIYARILQAAVATNNLPALLLSLGRYHITLDRLRAQISRSLFYPLLILFALALLATLIGSFVLPQMHAIFGLFVDKPIFYARGWGSPPSSLRLPLSTQLVMAMSPYIPIVAIAIAALIFCIPIITFLLRFFRLQAPVADAVVLRLPLIGSAIKHSALARYTDILAISVRSGLDLPAALRLAGDTIAYPRLVADSNDIARAIESGQSPTATIPRLVPQTTTAALALSQPGTSLADTLSMLALLHQQQAEVRASRIPILLLPIALLLLSAIVALLMAAIIAPLTTALRGITG